MLPCARPGWTPGRSTATARSGGSAVTDAAYFMLKANAEYIKSFIDIPALSFTYVCGPTFLIRNYSYPSFVMSLTGTSWTIPVTVPGRTADGPEYADLRVNATTTLPVYPLTPTLGYGGVVVKTATGSGPAC
jgi:hypothetical protein